jgi:hypothetical protein
LVALGMVAPSSGERVPDGIAGRADRSRNGAA